MEAPFMAAALTGGPGACHVGTCSALATTAFNEASLLAEMTTLLVATFFELVVFVGVLEHAAKSNADTARTTNERPQRKLLR
jgi:preprotein translocase subunit SecG